MSLKSIGSKPLLAPLPVLIVATWKEDGTADAMNVAWGGQISPKHLDLNNGGKHKTTENLRNKKAFTVSLANRATLVAADYVGIVSGNNAPDKMEKSGLTVQPAEHVDAPLLTDFPITLECKLVSMEEETGGEIRVIGEVVNTLVDESLLNEEGKVDLGKAELISYDSPTHSYRVLGEVVGAAFSDGSALK